jgi:hypothetical protein
MISARRYNTATLRNMIRRLNASGYRQIPDTHRNTLQRQSHRRRYLQNTTDCFRHGVLHIRDAPQRRGPVIFPERIARSIRPAERTNRPFASWNSFTPAGRKMQRLYRKRKEPKKEE